MFEETLLPQGSYPLTTRQSAQPETFGRDLASSHQFTSRIPSNKFFPAGVKQQEKNGLLFDENSLTETESEGEMDLQLTNDNPNNGMMIIAAASEKTQILPSKPLNNTNNTSPNNSLNTVKKSVVKAFSSNNTSKGKANYNCSYCDNSFTNSEQFSRHERLHKETPELLFNCSYCRKSFARNDYLTRHERIHTGEKPFSCSFCDKSFHQSSNLIVHERTHTGERPFACSLCDKSFINSSNRATHMKTHNLNWDKKQDKKMKS